MSGLSITPLALPGLAIVEALTFADSRGWFVESFNQRDFNEALANAGLPPAQPMVQDNHSFSREGVIRGLHFQVPPRAQGKLVRVLQGAVFDVVVDIRAASPAFGRWHALELSSENRRQLWVPPGFAHGFQVLGDSAQVFYKTTGYYDPTYERSIAWNDPSIGIRWPSLAIAVLSAKDRAAPEFDAIRPELLALRF